MIVKNVNTLRARLLNSCRYVLVALLSSSEEEDGGSEATEEQQPRGTGICNRFSFTTTVVYTVRCNSVQFSN